MAPVDEAKVPPARKAKAAFAEAMDHWDEAKADVAAAGLARTATPAEAFELFARYGCRDFRDIGHKAIYVANAFRTLRVIGWQHAEPVLRSLAYALLTHEGENPAKPDDAAGPPRSASATPNSPASSPPSGATGKHDPAADHRPARRPPRPARTATSSGQGRGAAERRHRRRRSVWDAAVPRGRRAADAAAGHRRAAQR